MPVHHDRSRVHEGPDQRTGDLLSVAALALVVV
jgi:hypothetical protein